MNNRGKRKEKRRMMSFVEENLRKKSLKEFKGDDIENY